MTCKKRFNQSGFTLIEIIVTVVIVAILGAMVLTFFSKSLVDSSEPVKRFKKTSDLNSIMANITADFNRYPKWRISTRYAVGNYIVPTIRNGHYYKCTSCGMTCISGSTEPDWPLNSGATKTDGFITWTETIENGSLISLVDLQNNINNKNYGTYDVVYNTFVYFPVGSDLETAGGSNILKVTIKNDQGETLSALFISN
jgi:prepilin-type N-terminal cleavage/methylation domain-containing protein